MFCNMLVILFCVFSILCILRFCIVSPFVYSCLFPIFVQIYRPLPPVGNPLAVNKYRISSYILRSHTENVKRSDTGGLRWPDRPHVSVLHRPSCVCVCVGIQVRCEVDAQGGQMSIVFNHVVKKMRLCRGWIG
jgi:hypothetical protein